MASLDMVQGACIFVKPMCFSAFFSVKWKALSTLVCLSVCLPVHTGKSGKKTTLKHAQMCPFLAVFQFLIHLPMCIFSCNCSRSLTRSQQMIKTVLAILPVPKVQAAVWRECECVEQWVSSEDAHKWQDDEATDGRKRQRIQICYCLQRTQMKTTNN